MDLLVHGAELIWTGRRELPGADLLCRRGMVAGVGSGASAHTDAGRIAPSSGNPPPEEPKEAKQPDRLDASGCVVIPGLVNAHHHLLQSAFRTLEGTRRVRMDAWLSAMAGYYRAAAVDPPLAAAAAAVAAAEGLLAGITTVADHHLTWPETCDPNELASAVIGAAAEAEVRLVFVRGTAGDDPEKAAENITDLVATYGAGEPHGKLQIACGPAGVHSDGPETFALLGEVAAKHGLRRRTQANEQVDVERAERRWGRRPLDLLESWGWLAPDVTLAHLCEITPAEVARLAESGACATHAPGCDVPMGWGVAPVGELLDAGVSVGLGTSGGGSNDAGHLLADARLALQVGGLSSRPLTAHEVLRMAASGSAFGLGRDELGHLEPGAAADFCCYDVSGPADAGVGDKLAGLLWANPGRRPKHVVVGGKVVVRDGELLTLDASKAAERLRVMMAERLSRGSGRQASRQASR